MKKEVKLVGHGLISDVLTGDLWVWAGVDQHEGKDFAVTGTWGSNGDAYFCDVTNPDSMIIIDDIDVNRIASKDLRNRVGVVLQDFHIFSGTIRDNITLNDPEISDDRAEWAARVVNADKFIRELPDGYETELSERGKSLSQGQRQLLAFARVLAADPEVLVLDEATASIDTATEMVIQDALHKLTEGRSSIIIAHRLQTIRECDRVLVLHHGEVKEIGTHEELLAKQGIYFTLHELQFQDAAAANELLGLEESNDSQRQQDLNVEPDFERDGSSEGEPGGSMPR